MPDFKSSLWPTVWPTSKTSNVSIEDPITDWLMAGASRVALLVRGDIGAPRCLANHVDGAPDGRHFASMLLDWDWDCCCGWKKCCSPWQIDATKGGPQNQMSNWVAVEKTSHHSHHDDHHYYHEMHDWFQNRRLVRNESCASFGRASQRLPQLPRKWQHSRP
eukprot:scaffold129402_cov58-Attheya_sp.AAC.1